MRPTCEGPVHHCQALELKSFLWLCHAFQRTLSGPVRVWKFNCSHCTSESRWSVRTVGGWDRGGWCESPMHLFSVQRSSLTGGKKQMSLCLGFVHSVLVPRNLRKQSLPNCMIANPDRSASRYKLKGCSANLTQ